MSLRRELRDGEVVVVSVTPTAQGVVGPAVALALLAALLAAVMGGWTWPREHGLLLALVFLSVPSAVLATRIWAWQSRRIVLSDQRLIMMSGVTKKRVTAVELGDIVAVSIAQQLLERLSRRGVVVLHLGSGSIALDRTRRPDALRRVIDHQRSLLDRVALRRLDEADHLRQALDDGLLSDDEYDQRWRHLFGPEGPRGRG